VGSASIPELHLEVRRVNDAGRITCALLAMHAIRELLTVPETKFRIVAAGAGNRIVHGKDWIVIEHATQRDGLYRWRIVYRNRQGWQPEWGGTLDGLADRRDGTAVLRTTVNQHDTGEQNHQNYSC